MSNINANYDSTGILAEAVVMDDGGAGIKLTQSTGMDISILTFDNDGADDPTMDISKDTGAALDAVVGESAANASAADNSIRIYGEVNLTSSQGIISTTASAGTLLDSADANTASTLNSLSVASVSGASAALATIDAALDTVNSGRGALGAVQNRFESVVASQQVASENLSASKSRIEDADFAAETAQLTKAQILQQSGIAMLAQANSLPQNVLALLQ